jgi:hypothetical protein
VAKAEGADSSRGQTIARKTLRLIAAPPSAAKAMSIAEVEGSWAAGISS